MGRSNILPLLGITTILLLFTACIEKEAPKGDYQANTQAKQSVPITTQKKLILVTSFPESRIVVVRHPDRAIKLDFVVSYSVTDMKGDGKEKPTARPRTEAEVQFKQKSDVDTITLTAKEFTVMQHSQIITKLNVQLPMDVELVYSNQDSLP